MQINQKFSSQNYSIRTEEIKYIIIHYTEMLFDDAIRKLCDPKSKVSSHYLIKDDGQVFQLVDDKYKAWHAGVSYWKNDSNINECSIGIELDNLGNTEFSKKQLDNLAKLCKILMNKYSINYSNVIGHSDIAPERKIDPGIFFDWYKLGVQGIGHLSNVNLTKNLSLEYIIRNKNVFDEKDIKQKLAKLGYNIHVDLNYVIRAFQSHFYPKIIIQKGINYYYENNSQYYWDIYSDNILNILVNKFT